MCAVHKARFSRQLMAVVNNVRRHDDTVFLIVVCIYTCTSVDCMCIIWHVCIYANDRVCMEGGGGEENYRGWRCEACNAEVEEQVMEGRYC